MNLPKHTTLLTREKLNSVVWCNLDVMIFDIESRVIDAHLNGLRVFSVDFDKIRGYDKNRKEKLCVMIEAMGYIVTVEENKIWIGL